MTPTAGGATLGTTPMRRYIFPCFPFPAPGPGESMTTDGPDRGDSPFTDQRIAFVGKLGGVSRREARRLVRQCGGVPADSALEADWVIIGADELPLGDHQELLGEDVLAAAAAGKLRILSETQFWESLGAVEGEQQLVRRLYTPAMLADLLKVSVATVRRWHRRGLISPIREVHRLPYFDFQEVATARHLAQLLAAGASPAAVERKLEALSRYYPDLDRPLAQLAIIVEGQQLLLRQGEGLIEPGGQRRIDFDAVDSGSAEAAKRATVVAVTVPCERGAAEIPPLSPEALCAQAVDLEDSGELALAAEMYRAALVAGGPSPETSFQLAELLYRLGDLSAARERYYMAIEQNEDYVEARANLGCVLAETGQLELAVAAFQGALQFHGDFPDVHYHLARVLDDLERSSEARGHWARFLELAADSPWADEARIRLQDSSGLPGPN